MLFLLILAGCRPEAPPAAPGGPDPASDVAGCDPADVAARASAEGVQIAFRPCGENQLADLSWSPDGARLYFRVPEGAYLLTAADKTIAALPFPGASGDGAWLRPDLIATTLEPEPGGERPRLSTYDLTKNLVNTVVLPLDAPRDLQPAEQPGDALLLGVGPDGARRPYRVDFDRGEVERVFPFIDSPVERLSYAPAAGLVAWSDAAGSVVARLDGEALARLPGVSRAIPHPLGRYVALEIASEHSDLPELQLLDLQRGARYRVAPLQADHFEWYQPRSYYSVFRLRGVGGEHLNPNVGLADLAERLRAAERGEPAPGLEALPLDWRSVSPQTPLSDGASLRTPQDGALPQ